MKVEKKKVVSYKEYNIQLHKKTGEFTGYTIINTKILFFAALRFCGNSLFSLVIE
jgi:hypothetical protein